MPQETKQYKLKKGYHRYPNPEYDYNKQGPQLEPTHIVATQGDMVPLSDEQYAAFYDRFEPNESAASEVRDRELQKIERAKQLAEELGESVDPNVVPPRDSPSTDERFYQGTTAGRAGMFPLRRPADMPVPQEGDESDVQIARAQERVATQATDAAATGRPESPTTTNPTPGTTTPTTTPTT